MAHRSKLMRGLEEFELDDTPARVFELPVDQFLASDVLGLCWRGF